jgi:hypothetical protein
MSFRLATAAILSIAFAGAANAAITVSIAAPGVQNSTKTLATSGVETFDGLSGYQGSYDTTFGGSPFAATITNFFASDANVYGGAGGAGKFVTAAGTTDITFTGGPAVNYFGLWVSALDANNSVAFFNGATQLGLFNLTQLLNAQPNAAAYLGNPNGGGNGGEAYAFIDFSSSTAFDKVQLTQGGGGGFELDNATLGVGAVPEPATWGMMLVGFGLVGAIARRRRRTESMPAVAA